MKKQVLIHYYLVAVLSGFGYLHTINAMPPEEEELQKALDMSLEDYKKEQQRKKQQEDELMKKLEDESRLLEQQREEKWRHVDEVRMQQVLKISEKEHLKEQEKREKKEREIKEREAKRWEENRIFRELIMQFGTNAIGADAVVVVYNPAAPVESIEITESDGTVRKGVARSVAKAIWDIPITMVNKPFTVAVVAYGRSYKWEVPFFDQSSLELGLIKKITPNDFEIKLYRMWEYGKILDRDIIEPYSVVPIK